MTMRTCKYCNSRVQIDKMFKLVINGKARYYCNEKECQKHLSEQELHDKVYEKLCELLGGKTKNNDLNKEWKKWTATDEVILSFLISEYNMISDVMSRKTFDNERGKIMYLSAIINNRINDFKNSYYAEKEAPKYVSFDYYEPKYKARKKRKSIQDYILEYGGEQH